MTTTKGIKGRWQDGNTHTFPVEYFELKKWDGKEDYIVPRDNAILARLDKPGEYHNKGLFALWTQNEVMFFQKRPVIGMRLDRLDTLDGCPEGLKERVAELSPEFHKGRPVPQSWKRVEGRFHETGPGQRKTWVLVDRGWVNVAAHPDARFERKEEGDWIYSIPLPPDAITAEFRCSSRGNESVEVSNGLVFQSARAAMDWALEQPE